jgi:hypothetical protein
METGFISILHPAKERGGDFAAAFQEDVLIGCVADGVSGAPCDWKASEPDEDSRFNGDIQRGH